MTIRLRNAAEGKKRNRISYKKGTNRKQKKVLGERNSQDKWDTRGGGQGAFGTRFTIKKKKSRKFRPRQKKGIGVKGGDRVDQPKETKRDAKHTRRGRVGGGGGEDQGQFSEIGERRERAENRNKKKGRVGKKKNIIET